MYYVKSFEELLKDLHWKDWSSIVSASLNEQEENELYDCETLEEVQKFADEFFDYCDWLTGEIYQDVSDDDSTQIEMTNAPEELKKRYLQEAKEYFKSEIKHKWEYLKQEQL